MNDRELLAQIGRSAGGKAGYKQLVRELGLGGGRERRLLLEQLARMTARGDLVKTDREHWSLPRKTTGGSRENLVAGRLDLHRDGYGFVRPNARQGAGKEDDVFIPPDEINGAMQGDQVLVELAPPRADGRRLGRIARILERRNPTVVGIFHYARSDREQGHKLVPFDERMTQPIVIPRGQEIPPEAKDDNPHRVIGREAAAAAHYDDLEGLVVDVEITSWPTPTRPAVGRVVEVLGDPDDFGVDVEMMIRKHQLPRVFPEKVLAEARAVAFVDEVEVNRRQDFRNFPIVTIDGETARDFDDAVLVNERPDGGFELHVHIADVAEYVGAGTDLDLEARIRGTSVYFPDRAIPMLPQELSTDVCSLRPKEDRLVLSCVMQLTSNGRVESFKISEGVIRSAERMTYTDVHAILDGDAKTRARYEGLVPNFERMKRLALLMNKRREERGSIDFDLPEPVIEFDEQGQMRGVTRAERTWANRLIEEFMLAANECVATWLEDLGVPSLYRIHEKPDPRRVVQFEELAASFGYTLGLGALPVKRVQTRGDRREAQRSGRQARTHEVPEDIAVTPKMYQKLAARVEGKPEERILSYLMLRSLSQARYSEINEGHFALAAPTYTHFTSPIRRYPDLIVHRITKALLRAGVDGRGEVAEGRHASPWTHPNEGLKGLVIHHGKKRHDGGSFRGEPPIAEAELAQIAEESSQAERRAAEAERELVEWKKVRFMQDRVGEEFAGLVLNPTKYGMFVELTDLFVEGLVPIESLRDDRYTWRENTHEIVGERWGRRFRAGDRVQVVLDRILAQERRLQFSIAEEGIPLTGKKQPKAPKKTKRKSPEQAIGSQRKKSRFANKRGRRR
ncbi:ribonuclease R family protein [Occallatibacter savannae]|uniref:ribonuclease R family protein n=1 Tax=Occallatibacter savannae TaxID=1002691 RepID=UPI000D6A0545|nr:VacB/RNase II family 3'-5' exoribonuclease [Occallatibacter savannae]